MRNGIRGWEKWRSHQWYFPVSAVLLGAPIAASERLPAALEWVRPRPLAEELFALRGTAERGEEDKAAH